MATKNNARQRPLIHCLSDEELVAELNRRKQEAAKPPEPLANPNFAEITKLATEMVNTLSTEGYEMKDQAHWCFEAVLTAVYGKTIWDWWNARLNDSD